MAVQDAILERLRAAQGEVVSGETLAKEVGVSRNSIWKGIKKLQETGYDITAKTNHGYALRSCGDVLTAAEVSSHLLPEEKKQLQLTVTDSVTSTNTIVKAMAEEGAPEGTVLIAQLQTQGKGRLGRAFYSPIGTGIYMSLLLRPRVLAQAALQITTAAAVAVCKGIECATGKKAGIKWVNDIFLNGKKVCGILSEAAMDFETGGLQYVVVGIGVNVKPPASGFPEEIAQIAGALYKTEPNPGIRARLCAAILQEFMAIYRQLGQEADENRHRTALMAEYRRRSILTGLHITYQQGMQCERGTVTGIDDQARLLVQLESGEQRAYSAGEVQLDKTFLTQLSEGGQET